MLIQCIAHLCLSCTIMLIISIPMHCTTMLIISNAMHPMLIMHNYAYHKHINSNALHNYAYHKQGQCTMHISNLFAYLIISNLIPMHCTTMLIISNLIPMHCTTMLNISNAVHNYVYHKPFNSNAHNYAYHKQCSAQRCL